MKSGLTLITEERLRHIDKGYTPSHDDQHKTGEIVAAARCYALLAETQNPGHGWTKAMVEDHIFENEEWPWDSEDWKPSESQTQNLIKAGAMIAAEIDRLHRLDYHHRRSDLNASGTRTYGECPSCKGGILVSDGSGTKCVDCKERFYTKQYARGDYMEDDDDE